MKEEIKNIIRNEIDHYMQDETHLPNIRVGLVLSNLLRKIESIKMPDSCIDKLEEKEVEKLDKIIELLDSINRAVWQMQNYN